MLSKLRKKRKGMFIKLFTTYIVILCISFIMIGLVVNTMAHNEIIKRYHNAFDHQKEKVIQYFETAESEGWEQSILTSSLELALNQEDRVAVFLIDEYGGVDYNPKLFEEYDMEMSLRELAMSEEETSMRLHTEDRVVYFMSGPIEILTEDNPKHTITMVFHEFDQELKQISSIIHITVLVAIIIAGIIIFYTSRKMTSPLREMNHSALQFAKGDFSHRVNIKSKDEIGQLAETFNYMAKELASIDQMRKDFVANVSHDLRSPLTSIKGFLGAMMDGTIPQEQQYKYFSIMKNETERLMKLVNDLLDMARLEAGQMEVEPISYNFSEQLRLTIAKMEPTLSENQLDIELLGEEEDVFVHADPNRMEQVLVNLLQNAVQFSKEKGSIDVAIMKEGDNATIRIRDYGHGMSESDVRYIWERFYKKDKARSSKSGTGIGLSIVKHIIDLHDTTIKVESDLDKGTTFTFTLPLAKLK
ncbi:MULTISPECIES: sensor histidine kinase [Bacillaceae]|uniref:histidine kinase n=1 Tax=Evansella alkalicola TaxID=745819 RepID=A0ABS6JQV5_9BACI|nr:MULTISPECIES: HAMP domain-containing sensor histidine kinase [Bacillaceae]MBU9720938.1 HAMP domain-containing histidine kinase [Bacillus alkalicola]